MEYIIHIFPWIYKPAGKNGKEGAAVPRLRLSKAGPEGLAEFAPAGANRVKTVFGQGVYLAKNSSHGAREGFVRNKRAKPARSGVQLPVKKAFGLFDRLRRERLSGVPAGMFYPWGFMV